MVVGIEDKAVVREYYALGSAGILAFGVDIAFGVGASFCLWQEPLIVAVAVASNGVALLVLFDRAARPAEVLGVRFFDKVAGQMSVSVDIQRDVVL